MIRFGLCCIFNEQPIRFRRTTAAYLSNASNIKRHHDFIDINDVPPFWIPMDITVEVEAKAKEVAVLKLMADLDRGGVPLVSPSV